MLHYVHFGNHFIYKAIWDMHTVFPYYYKIGKLTTLQIMSCDMSLSFVLWDLTVSVTAISETVSSDSRSRKSSFPSPCFFMDVPVSTILSFGLKIQSVLEKKLRKLHPFHLINQSHFYSKYTPSCSIKSWNNHISFYSIQKKKLTQNNNWSDFLSLSMVSWNF